MDALSTTFSALADPTRRAILARLAQGETHVGELGRPFAISAPAVSRHLRVLEAAGLIERETQAQWRICRVRGPELQAAHDWLQQYREFWEASLDRLVEYLERPAASAPAPQPTPPRRSPARKTPRRRSRP